MGGEYSSRLTREVRTKMIHTQDGKVRRRQNIWSVYSVASGKGEEDVVIVEELTVRILAFSGVRLQTTTVRGMAIAKPDETWRLSVSTASEHSWHEQGRYSVFVSSCILWSKRVGYGQISRRKHVESKMVLLEL